MAGAALCVSCASLPIKNQSLAITTKVCPECKVAFGVTSYGAAFRMHAPEVPKRYLSPMSIMALTAGAGLFTLVMALTIFGLWSRERVIGPEPGAAAPPPNELARVKEVAVEDRFDHRIMPHAGKQHVSTLVAKIRTVNNNQGNKDAFVLANIKVRPELAGLPFIMGDACRLDMGRANEFQSAVVAAREGMESDFRIGRIHEHDHTPFWNTYLAQTHQKGTETDPGIAALSQILGPERKTLRVQLIHQLKKSNRPDANRVIARAAVFDSEGDVRAAAIKVLKEDQRGRSPEVTEVLMHGIRYPLAVVAKRSAKAIISLDRKDLLPQLADVLQEPTPGDPVEKKVDDQVVHVVNEVVKINHHRNCLLCHPPATQQAPESEVPGVIPSPGTPFSTSPKDAYGNAQMSGDPMVRADTTYLRQDFSVMMPVENAAPWPEMQRFDFLVRSRPVKGDELAALQQKVQARPADFQSENQKAALLALSELSGQRNVAPNAAAWQRVVGARPVE